MEPRAIGKPTTAEEIGLRSRPVIPLFDGDVEVEIDLEALEASFAAHPANQEPVSRMKIVRD